MKPKISSKNAVEYSIVIIHRLHQILYSFLVVDLRSLETHLNDLKWNNSTYTSNSSSNSTKLLPQCSSMCLICNLIINIVFNIWSNKTIHLLMLKVPIDIESDFCVVNIGRCNFFTNNKSFILSFHK